MHQTTVRFGADLWQTLEAECAELGISVAQFVREAALARVMYMAGRRAEPDFEHAFGRAATEVSQSSALWAQGEQARRRARELRDESVRRRLAR
jgi:hypothetical protein